MFCFVDRFLSHMHTWYQCKHTCMTHQNRHLSHWRWIIWCWMYILGDESPIWDDLNMLLLNLLQVSDGLINYLSQKASLHKFGHWKLHHVITCYCSSEKIREAQCTYLWSSCLSMSSCKAEEGRTSCKRRLNLTFMTSASDSSKLFYHG